MTATTITPVRKRVRVSHQQGEAFRIFTEEISTWWPTAPYALEPDRVARVVAEPRVGGRVFEVWDDGSEHDWAEVLAWDPPHGFVWRWHLGMDPGTEVEIRFSPDGEGTLVEVEHRRWERLEDGARVRDGYDSGWPVVLDRFAQRA